MTVLKVRSSALTGYVELTQSLGADPDTFMRAAGIDPTALAMPNTWLPAERVDELLERTALATSCVDFAVQMADGRGVSILGAVGLAAREEPDVRSAIALILRHMRVHNEAIRIQLVELNGLASLRIAPAPGMTFGRQSIELVVASLARILDAFLPDGWRPLSTWFVHEAPATLDVHHRAFGTDITFEQEFNGFVLYSSDLDSVNPLSDPMFQPYARQYLDLLAPPEDATAVGRVREMIEALLPGGSCTAARIARSLGMDRRTLHRHLSRAGENYSSVVDSVRVDLARRYIARGDRNLTDIAGELGFSDLSAFSRWFSRQFGTSPSKWAAHQHETRSV